ncbi:MAG: UDP-N-acetylmuramate dehydrogenase [Paludibacter sp.]|nr:UDP-N-acetylmuramate dehydrogenase [Paludibacter sp.]
MNILNNISLLPYNSFGIDVQTKYFADYQSIEQLRELLESDIVKNEKLLHIGGGNNLLFVSYFQGVILHSQIKFIAVTEENDNSILLRVGSGVIWDDFVNYCVINNYCGAENLSSIPSEVGAAAVQNIGAYGAEISDIVRNVETIDIKTLEKQIFTNSQCNYGYRTSIFKNDLKGEKIVTAVEFCLSKKPNFNLNYTNLEQEILKNYSEINLTNIRATIISIREGKLPNPKIMGNAGSFFKNPYIFSKQYERLKKDFPKMPYFPINEDIVKIPAAYLIEQCGWKRKFFGDAGVYEKNPLVIVNQANATSTDILSLAKEIQKSVKKKFDIDLETEVELI